MSHISIDTMTLSDAALRVFRSPVAHSDTVPSHAVLAANADSPPAYVGPSTPGYCYLNLFKDCEHARLSDLLKAYPPRGIVEAHLTSNTAAIHPGPFGLTFGVSRSVLMSQKFLCHVTRLPEGSSLLRARDVATIMPYGSVYGADPDEVPHVSLATTDAAPTSLSILGSVPNPLHRRFMTRAAVITLGTDIASSLTSFANPASQAPVLDFIRYAQSASWARLAVHFVALPHAARYLVQLNTAWFPSTETAPNSITGFCNSPTHTVHLLGPAFPGGKPESAVVECTMSYGIQKQFKPLPHFGGSPKFAWLMRVGTMGEFDHAGAVPIYEVFFEMEVDISSPF